MGPDIYSYGDVEFWGHRLDLEGFGVVHVPPPAASQSPAFALSSSALIDPTLLHRASLPYPHTLARGLRQTAMSFKGYRVMISVEESSKCLSKWHAPWPRSWPLAVHQSAPTMLPTRPPCGAQIHPHWSANIMYGPASTRVMSTTVIPPAGGRGADCQCGGRRRCRRRRDGGGGGGGGHRFKVAPA